jgi:RNA polymerase sigma factor (sigma-70 family)
MLTKEHEKIITDTYNKYRNPFLEFATKKWNSKNFRKEIFEDIYQETMLEFHQNLKEEKIDFLNDLNDLKDWKKLIKTKYTKNTKDRLKIYLFTIGDRKIFDYDREMKKIEIDDSYNKEENENDDKSINKSLENMSQSDDTEEENAVIDRNMIVYNAVREMENPCKKLLILYYTENMNMKEIAEQMNYNSPDVAKTKKHGCMKKIKLILTKKLKEADLL